MKLSEESENNGTRYRRNKEELAVLKNRIAVYVAKSRWDVTPSEIVEELTVAYPTALAMLMELTLEGTLKMRNKSGQRRFQAVPDKNLTVIKA